jgi:hypothetical protein
MVQESHLVIGNLRDDKALLRIELTNRMAKDDRAVFLALLYESNNDPNIESKDV